MIANPRMVRAIAYARVKTDKIDAITLARLQASGFLPEVWAADEDTVRRRRQAAERMGLLEETVCLKSRIHAILHANLVPKYKGALFGAAGQRWLDKTVLPDQERLILDRLIDELRHTCEQLAVLDQELAGLALTDERAVRLLTIPGVGPIVAAMVLSSIGTSRALSPRRSSRAILASGRRCGSAAKVRAVTGKSRTGQRQRACWSRLRGRRRPLPGRCAPSSCASVLNAAPRRPSLPLHGSWPC